VGLDDRLRAAMRHTDDPGELPEPDVLRRRARRHVWQRRASLGVAVVLVAATASVVVVHQRDNGRPARVAVRKGLVQVPADAELAVSSVSSGRARPD